jgi:prephenate dehydrogenase
VGGYDRYDENILKYSAGGFRDFTRIASSDPVMWRDIALLNRDGILETMDLYIKSFTQLRELVEKEDGPGLQDFFARSKQSRDAI